LVCEETKKAAVVDPYDVDKVSAAAESLGVQLVAGITTHHHYDHSGGNQAFAAKYGVPIYGGSDQVAALTKLVKDKDEFTIGDSILVQCLATPCHTQDSICYHVTDTVNKLHPGGVFTGDTLFIAGCGRFFEGTADQMIAALSYLASLPDSTVVYNGHEYTAGNVAFAKSVDPKNKDIIRLADLTRENKTTTGLTTIGDEKKWNVFMRLDDDAVRQATGTNDGSDIQVMAALREMKNKFRGSL